MSTATIIFYSTLPKKEHTHDTIFIKHNPPFTIKHCKNAMMLIRDFIANKSVVHIKNELECKKYNIFVSFLAQYIILIHKEGDILFEDIHFLPSRVSSKYYLFPCCRYTVEDIFYTCPVLKIFKIYNKNVQLSFINCINERVLNNDTFFTGVNDNIYNEFESALPVLLRKCTIPPEILVTRLDSSPTNFQLTNEELHDYVSYNNFPIVSFFNNSANRHISIKNYAEKFDMSLCDNAPIEELECESSVVNDNNVLCILEILKKHKDATNKFIHKVIMKYSCIQNYESICNILEYCDYINIQGCSLAVKPVFINDTERLKKIIWIGKSWVESDGWKKIINDADKEKIIANAHNSYYGLLPRS
jgi:hypothetical protein